MSSDQPYRPPESDVGGPPSGSGAGAITPGIIDALKRTRGWVLLMGIMGMLGCALMVLGALVMFAVGSQLQAQSGAPIGGAVLGLVYLLMAALYFIPTLRLLRYASEIKKIDGPASVVAVEAALTEQQKFWRFIGIITLTVLGIYAVIFLGAIVLAIGSGVAG